MDSVEELAPQREVCAKRVIKASCLDYRGTLTIVLALYVSIRGQFVALTSSFTHDLLI